MARHLRSKKAIFKRHTKKRLSERYGFKVDVEFIRQAVITGKATFLYRSGRKRGAYLVQLNNSPVVAIYDFIQHAVVTVLPYRPVKPSWYNRDVVKVGGKKVQIDVIDSPIAVDSKKDEML